MFINVEKELTKEDTLALVDSYFTKRSYTDSLETEYGYIVINDVLWKNRIYSRNYSYELSVPHVRNTITKTVIKKPSRFSLYIGAGGIVMLTENPNMFGFNRNLLPSAYAGTSFRLYDHHKIHAEYDFYRKDWRFGYSYINNRWEILSEYSTRYNMLQVGARFYILK